jgi:hypothetical protein
MANSNTELPENFKHLIDALEIGTAVPLANIQNMPFLGLKLPNDDQDMLKNGEIISQFKPTLLNIDYEEQTYAILILQVILNGSEDYIYNTFYDLNNEQQFTNALEILKLSDYGLFIFTDEVHDFIPFNTKTDINFDPCVIATATKKNASEYQAETCHAIVTALFSSQTNNSELLKFFEEIAPKEKEWYARLTMNN